MPTLSELGRCLFFTLTVILAGHHASEACIHDLRLPHLCNKSLADPNAMHPRVFAARPSRALARPCLTVCVPRAPLNALKLTIGP